MRETQGRRIGSDASEKDEPLKELQEKGQCMPPAVRGEARQMGRVGKRRSRGEVV